MEVYNNYKFEEFNVENYKCKKYKNAVYTIIDEEVNKHCNKCQKFLPLNYFTNYSKKRDACLYRKDGKCNQCIRAMRKSRERKYYEKTALKKNPNHVFNNQKIKAVKEKVKKIKVKMEKLTFRTLKELYENLKKECDWHIQTKMELIKKVEELELENYKLKGQEPPHFDINEHIKVDFPNLVSENNSEASSSNEEELVNKTIKVKSKKPRKVKISKTKVVNETLQNLASTSIVPNELNIEKTVEYIVEDSRDYNEMLRTIEQQQENDLAKKVAHEAIKEVKQKINKKSKPLCEVVRSEASVKSQKTESQVLNQNIQSVSIVSESSQISNKRSRGKKKEAK